MTSSKILLYLLLSFIFGVFVSSFFNIPELIIYQLFIFGAFYSFAAFFQKEYPDFKQLLVILAVCFIFFGIGIFRTEIAKEDGLLYSSFRVEESSLEFFSSLRKNLREIIYQNFSPPHSSILAALTLGDKGKISKIWKEKLNIAGVRHITAISGMHIVILSSILLWFFIILGFYRNQAFYLVLLAIWFFIFLSGLQISSVRAGIMGSIFLLSQKLGRERSAVRVLILAAALILAFDPLALRYNIGFQLSFLAVLGLIFLLPSFKKFFERIKLLRGFNLSYLLGVTFSAQVFVLPILIYNFGHLSLTSPLANLLIVPILPFLMGLGFLFLVAGLIWQPLGFLFSLFVYPLLGYLVFVINFFSSFQLFYLGLKFPWEFIPIYYLLLTFFIFY